MTGSDWGLPGDYDDRIARDTAYERNASGAGSRLCPKCQGPWTPTPGREGWLDAWCAFCMADVPLCAGCERPLYTSLDRYGPLAAPVCYRCHGTPADEHAARHVAAALLRAEEAARLIKLEAERDVGVWSFLPPLPVPRPLR